MELELDKYIYSVSNIYHYLYETIYPNNIEEVSIVKINEWLYNIFNILCLEKCHLVYFLIYIYRTDLNIIFKLWKEYSLCIIMIVQKYLNDEVYINKDILELYMYLNKEFNEKSILDLETLNNMEIELIKMLKYKLYVTNELYKEFLSNIEEII